MKTLKSAGLFLLVVSSSIYSVNAQSSKALFSLGQKKHYADEFEYAYSKNNLSTETKKDSINAYLDLYINFRLKVKEAKLLGYDTTKVFKDEFELYKKQLEDTYLSPKKEQEALIKEAYERSLWKIKASHILIRITPKASATDTLNAYKKITNIRNRSVAGESFSELAKTLSEDPSAKQNGGDLGYFSVFQMVYPFETAAYSTPVGEISKLIRTKFGYHIIKVVDKRANEGKIRVAHIMIKSTIKNGEEYQKKAKNKAFKLDSLLKSGGNWNKLCQIYSEDQNSKPQHGEIKPFGRGQIVPEFEKAAFQLKNVNDISAPIKSQYGWHIIKLMAKVPVGSYEEEESKLARKIKSDGRASMPRAEMLRTLKVQNNFYKNKYAATSIAQLPASVVSKGKWSFDSTQLANNEVLFSLGTISVTSGDFLENIKKQKLDARLGVKEQLEKLLANYEDSLVISYEKQLLPQKYPAYRFLVQEYYDGILLFSIMEDSIWNRSMQDSIGLVRYYKKNKDKYLVSEMDTTIFFSNTKEILEEAMSLSNKKMNREEWKKLKSNLLKKYNESPLTLQIVSADAPQIKLLQEANANELVEIESFWYWKREREVLEVTELEDVKGKAISDYQQYLDNDWINRLKKKYPIKIYKKSLNKVYEHFKATE